MGCIFVRDHIELLDDLIVPSSPSSRSSPGRPVLPKGSFEARLFSLRTRAILDVTSFLRSSFRQGTSQQFRFPPASGESSDPVAEVEAAQSLPPSFSSSSFILSFDSVRNMTSDWLRSLPKFLPPIEEALNVVGSCAELLQLRSAVVDCLQAPLPVGDIPLVQSGPVITWKLVSAVVLSDEVDPWSLLFQLPFLSRATAVIWNTVGGVIKMDTFVDVACSELVAALKKKDSGVDERSVGDLVWGDHFEISDNDSSLGLTKRTKSLVREFDNQLSAALCEVVPLVETRGSSCPTTMKSDARDLNSRTCVFAQAFWST